MLRNKEDGYRMDAGTQVASDVEPSRYQSS